MKGQKRVRSGRSSGSGAALVAATHLKVDVDLAVSLAELQPDVHGLPRRHGEDGHDPLANPAHRDLGVHLDLISIHLSYKTIRPSMSQKERGEERRLSVSRSLLL